MSKRQPLSKAEMEVARIVWERQQATVREVLENLPPSRQIDYKTVQTFLRRLETKGYLTSIRNGRSLTYRPTIQPHVVIQETIDDIVSHLFNGQIGALLDHLLLEHGLSKTELDRVQELLSAARARVPVT